MTFLVAIVTYNNAGDVHTALESVFDVAAADGVSACVSVVDNSPDGRTLAALRAFAASRPGACLHVAASGGNTGWSRGSNLAIANGIRAFADEPDFVLLLNPDARLATGSLGGLVAAFEACDRAGAAGGRLRRADGTHAAAFQPDWRLPDLLLQFAGYRLIRVAAMQRRLRRCTRPVAVADAVPSGAAVALRWSVYREVGGLDERYFLYSDDVDLARQVRASGHDVLYVPSLVIDHAGGASSDTLGADAVESEVRKQRYMLESQDRFVEKWYGSRLAAFVRWYEPRVTWRVRLLRALLTRRGPITPAVARRVLAQREDAGAS